MGLAVLAGVDGGVFERRLKMGRRANAHGGCGVGGIVVYFWWVVMIA